MTKHFCDKCGKEVSALTMWDIHCDARNTETHFHFEVCSECMLKLNKLLDSKSESEECLYVIFPECSYCTHHTLRCMPEDNACKKCVRYYEGALPSGYQQKEENNV